MNELPKSQRLSIHKAAEYLEVSIETLRRWNTKGLLVPKRTKGGQRRYSLDQLQAFRKTRRKPSRLQTPTTPNLIVNASEDVVSPLSNLFHTPVNREEFTSLETQNLPSDEAIVTSSDERISNQPKEPQFEHSRLRRIGRYESLGPDDFASEKKVWEMDDLKNLSDDLRKKRSDKYNRYFRFGTVVMLLLVLGTTSAAITLDHKALIGLVENQLGMKDSENSGKPVVRAEAKEQVGKVLQSSIQSTSRDLQAFFTVNIPSNFGDSTTFEQGFTSNGLSVFNGVLEIDGDIEIAGGDITANTVTANNLLYGITAGSGVSVSTGQTPTVTNTGVLSLQGQTGALSLTAGSGISITGLTISSSVTSANSFGKISVSGQSDIAAGSAGDTVTFAAGSGVTLTTSSKTLTIAATGGTSQWTTTGNDIYYASGNVGVGTTAPVGLLSIQGDPGGKALNILNYTGSDQNIFTASSSGSTVYTINNTGALTIPVYAGNNAVLYAAPTTGLFTTATTGSTGLCLVSGGTIPSWSSCSGAVGQTSNWNLFNGALSPKIDSLDVLVGSQATSSANIKLSGTRGNSAFNIIRGAANGQALVQLNELGNQAILTASASGTPVFSLDRSGNLNSIPGALWKPLTSSSTALAIADSSGTKLVTLGTSSNFGVGIGEDYTPTGNSHWLSIFNNNSGKNSLHIDSANATWDNYLIFAENANRPVFVVNNLGNVGIGTTVGNGLFVVQGAQVGKALVQFNETGNQDIFTASASGTSRFTVTNAGGIKLGTAEGSSGNCLLSGGTGAASTWGSCGGGSNWTVENGIAHLNLADTTSVLIGGSATSSASTRLSWGTGDSFINALGGNVGIGTTAPRELVHLNGGNLLIGQQTNSGQSAVQNWSKVSQSTAGTIASGGTASIASISAQVVYNGSLYAGTNKTNEAEVYRYDGTSGNWTKVSQSTAGTIASGGTANIDAVSSMTVHNGYLYIGTTELDSAEAYRYDGGTTWTKVSQATAGTIRSGGTASIDTVSALAVVGGRMYLGTTDPGRGELYRYDGGTSWSVLNTTPGTFVGGTTGNDGVSAIVGFKNAVYFTTRETNAAEIVRVNQPGTGTAFTRVINTAGQIANGGTANIDQVPSLTVFNGKMYAGTREANSAEVYRYDDTADASSVVWQLVTSSAGTITSGGTASIDGISSLAYYNGFLYAATEEPSSAEIYRYVDNGNWIKVSQGTAGQIAAGGTSSINGAGILQVYGQNLFVGTNKTSEAEIYQYTFIHDQSYALKFHAGMTQAGGEQNSLFNEASIYFQASPSAYVNSINGNTGQFVFSHTISTQNGAYDVAEDYGTRDDTLEPGDLVAIDEHENGLVRKTTGSYDKVMGVYSENPGLHLSQKDSHIDGARAVPIALVGRVPVKVSTENGPIKPGDALTSSSLPGVAMKATSAGMVIGRSMGEFSCPSSVASDQPEASQSGELLTVQQETENGEQKTDTCTGKVLTYINVSYHEPNVFFMNEGTIEIAKNEEGRYSLESQSDELFINKAAFEEGFIANLSAGRLSVDDVYITGNLTIKGLGFEDYLEEVLGGINSASSSAVNTRPTLLSEGKISSIEAQLSDVSKRVSLLERFSHNNMLASSPAFFSNSEFDSLRSGGSTVSGTLTVLGRTILSDVGVTGTLSTGFMTVDGLESSLNTIGEPLRLQNNGMAGIDILAGKVMIDTDGTVRILEKVIAKDVEAEKVRTNKLEIAVDEPVSVSSQSGAVAGENDQNFPSAGIVIVEEGETEIEVKTDSLTEKSLIFATPNRPVAVGAERKNSTTFVIRLKEAEKQPLYVQWWVIN